MVLGIELFYIEKSFTFIILFVGKASVGKKLNLVNKKNAIVDSIIDHVFLSKLDGLWCKRFFRSSDTILEPVASRVAHANCVNLSCHCIYQVIYFARQKQLRRVNTLQQGCAKQRCLLLNYFPSLKGRPPWPDVFSSLSTAPRLPLDLPQRVPHLCDFQRLEHLSRKELHTSRQEHAFGLGLRHRLRSCKYQHNRHK